MQTSYRTWEDYARHVLKDDGERIVEYSFQCMEEAFKAGRQSISPFPVEACVAEMEALGAILRRHAAQGAQPMTITEADAQTMRVLDMTTQQIVMLKNWFDSRSHKGMPEFWEEAFNAGVDTCKAVMKQAAQTKSVNEELLRLLKRHHKVSSDKPYQDSQLRLDTIEAITRAEQAQGTAAGSSNGRTADFESANAGSSPAPASTSQASDAPVLCSECHQPTNRAEGYSACEKCVSAAVERLAAIQTKDAPVQQPDDVVETVRHGLACAEIFVIKHCDKLNAGTVLTAIKEAQAAFLSGASREIPVVDEGKLVSLASEEIMKACKNGILSSLVARNIVRLFHPYLRTEPATSAASEGGAR